MKTAELTGIEADVCADIAQRQAKGIQKYGTTVIDNPLSLKAWLQHAYEECLDQAVYLKRAIAELDQVQLNSYRAGMEAAAVICANNANKIGGDEGIGCRLCWSDIYDAAKTAKLPTT